MKVFPTPLLVAACAAALAPVAAIAHESARQFLSVEPGPPAQVAAQPVIAQGSIAELGRARLDLMQELAKARASHDTARKRVGAALAKLSQADRAGDHREASLLAAIVRAAADEMTAARERVTRLERALERADTEFGALVVASADVAAPGAPPAMRAAPIKAPIPGAAPAGGAQGAGLVWAAPVGSAILAPSAGRVAFAGPFRSYGKVLIIETDREYALVMAGFETINARAGADVRPGERLGVLARSSEPADIGGRLYFEVRRNGAPVDAAGWLTGRT